MLHTCLSRGFMSFYASSVEKREIPDKKKKSKHTAQISSTECPVPNRAQCVERPDQSCMRERKTSRSKQKQTHTNSDTDWHCTRRGITTVDRPEELHFDWNVSPGFPLLLLALTNPAAFPATSPKTHCFHSRRKRPSEDLVKVTERRPHRCSVLSLKKFRQLIEVHLPHHDDDGAG